MTPNDFRISETSHDHAFHNLKQLVIDLAEEKITHDMYDISMHRHLKKDEPITHHQSKSTSIKRKQFPMPEIHLSPLC